MDACAHKLFARIFVFMIKSMIKRAVERDMDLVKGFCEKNGRRSHDSSLRTIPMHRVRTGVDPKSRALELS